jgi:hypothetical protein
MLPLISVEKIVERGAGLSGRIAFHSRESEGLRLQSTLNFIKFNYL